MAQVTPRARTLQPRPQLFLLKRSDVFVRIVQHRVEMGHHVHQPIVDLPHPAGEGPGELARRLADRTGGLRVDEVHHRLGLGQVQPAPQEGPLGELPGPGLPGPLGKEGLQPQGQHRGGAVALELRRLLPRITVARGGPGGQDPVDGPALPVHQGPVHQ